MKDKYSEYRELSTAQKRGKDFQVRFRRRNGNTVVLAPHGGGIEPGTSEIADAIAGADLSFYAFEGIKPKRNRELHITSTHFDEPRCNALIGVADRVIAIHGQNGNQDKALLGGRDLATIRRLRQSLEQEGFHIEVGGSPKLQGRSADNICNRGAHGRGVQIEICDGMRRTFFQDARTRRGRRIKTQRFRDFVSAVRRVIA
jgi:phage replication-related protein YjqB (UPF0714/DUF867 family)